MARQNLGWLAAVFILSLTSCQRAADSPKVTPVSGEVFVDGVAAKGATLVFIPMEVPDAGSRSWKLGYPRATVNEEGKFQVSTHTANDGAPTGKYRITVVWWAMDEESDQAAIPLRDQLGGRYSEPANTPLEVTVQDSPIVLPRFDLGAK